MCVGCSRGFEIVDLESLDTQGLLDPNDESLEFVRKRENLRPMAIYRIHNEFLLCYDGKLLASITSTACLTQALQSSHSTSTRMGDAHVKISWCIGRDSPLVLVSLFNISSLNLLIPELMTALHEPYVLAFEPSFVEIRHIETGLMSQVIQGSNLRLLFADTPPSVTNSASSMYQAPYQPGYEHNGSYTNPSNHGGYGARSPAYNGYGPPPPYPNHHQRNPQGIGRDEILMVSDDRVLALRTAAGPQRYMSDNVSMMSLPR